MLSLVKERKVLDLHDTEDFWIAKKATIKIQKKQKWIGRKTQHMGHRNHWIIT